MSISVRGNARIWVVIPALLVLGPTAYNWGMVRDENPYEPSRSPNGPNEQKSVARRRLATKGSHGTSGVGFVLSLTVWAWSSCLVVGDIFPEEQVIMLILAALLFLPLMPIALVFAIIGISVRAHFATARFSESGCYPVGDRAGSV